MQADVSFWDSLVFAGIDDLVVEAVTAVFGTVDVVARGWAAGAVCPDCGGFSNRVHDSYQRRLRDLPLGGFRVVILLTVRRFVCGSSDCPRRTVPAVDHPVRPLHQPPQPRPGAHRAGAGRTDRLPTGCPTRL
ncbi:transposase family protein [Streptomyces sp. NPDC005283]|uniref:transposase family protein n=1 Tax=Streptomyces sp. NPDC005283 TaxID=3156871 RepID=UPI003452021C